MGRVGGHGPQTQPESANKSNFKLPEDLVPMPWPHKGGQPMVLAACPHSTCGRQVGPWAAGRRTPRTCTRAASRLKLSCKHQV